MAGTNGGIIGKVNKTSFGKGLTTTKTSSGSLTTQAGTRLVETLVVAGGGGGGKGTGAGGGGGGFRQVSCVSVCGSTPYAVTVGGGGAGAGPSRGQGTQGEPKDIDE